jgi:shikimate kinase
MARLVLVGLPGVGKTTVAQELGRTLGCDVRDTDTVFFEREGATVQEVLRTRGEVLFRSLEAECLASVLREDIIVSTGGGIVTTARARSLLVGERTVWLDSPDDIVLERLEGGDRPLLGDQPAERLAALRAERSPWYREVASVRIDSSGELRDIVEAILSQEGLSA